MNNLAGENKLAHLLFQGMLCDMRRVKTKIKDRVERKRTENGNVLLRVVMPIRSV